MLVHAAAALRRERLGRRVTFVWFDLEESGLIGSTKYLEAHAGDRIEAMLNYDINGYGDTVLFGPPRAAPTRGCCVPCSRPARPKRIDCLRFDGMPPSDDRPFGARKIPTLSMAILPAAEAHQIWLVLHAKGARPRAGIHPAHLHDDSHAERRPGQARRERHRASRAAWRSP